jgi:hypothetical protein
VVKPRNGENLPKRTRAATKAQSANWLLTTPMSVYLRYFSLMDAVSIAADSHVPALHELGSRISSAHSRGGYAMCWWRRIIEVLCVMCARVRLGSMLMNALSREMFESFHF